MKDLLRLEELTQFLACLGLLITSDPAWWCYLLLLLGPDIGMLGYLVNARAGAITYNLFHHKGLALVVTVGGQYMSLLNFTGQGPVADWDAVAITGIILFGHASMDRIFGYGLKFGDSFQHTHLGWIGKLKGQEQGQGAGNAR